MRQPGALVPRDKLLDSVYGWGAEVESNAVEVHLHHLRRKLCPELILNVRGVGYRLGNGGGYAARTLAALQPGRRAIGVGFGLTAIPTIYPQWHDVAMDVVVTEAGVLTPEHGNGP